MSVIGPNRVLGIDASHWEPGIDWATAKSQAHIEFMITKATEGTGYVDDKLHLHFDHAHDADLLCGTYHFFHAGKSVQAQFDLYRKVVANIQAKHSIFAIDWEETSQDGMPFDYQQKQVLAMADAMAKYFGKMPWIYTDLNMLWLANEHIKGGLSQEFANYPLWLAGYIPEAKLYVPRPWKHVDIWQFSASKHFAGMASGAVVDTNVFNGSLSEMLAFVGKPEAKAA